MPHYTAPRTLSRKIEDYLDYGFTSNSTTSAAGTATGGSHAAVLASIDWEEITR